MQVDFGSLQILTATVIGPFGVQSAFFSLPNDANLIGLRVWLQAAIAPSGGTPGFTNAVYEAIQN